MSLSQNIKRIRQEKGMTQEQLANELGVSAQAVSKWETSETYPDGALLVPLADALGTSLDHLFDRASTTVPDVSARLWSLIEKAPEEERMGVVRTVGWQMEKGLFNALMPVAPGYAPAELTSGKRSYILSDHGFTHLSNNPVAPFFSVFEEPENGFGEALGDGEEIRRICAAMSRPETMRAILYIHSKEPWYLLDGEVLARECDISADLLDGVLADLGELCIIKRQRLEVDGQTLELYSTRPSHKLIALMILARELHYWSGYSYQSQHRSKPYIR